MSIPRTSALWLALILTTGLWAAGPRKIAVPRYAGSTTPKLDIASLTLSDTATIVDFLLDASAGGLQIGGKSVLIDNQGRQYALRRAEGITLDQPVMSESDAPLRFSLTFAPLPAGTAEVSFTEGLGEEGAFSIYGIRLDKRRPLAATEFPEAFATPAGGADMPLPAAVTSYGEATLRGRLLGYRADMPAAVSLVGYGVLDGLSAQALHIAPEGTFELKVRVAGTTPAALMLDRGLAYRIFLRPDQTTEICLNLPEVWRRASLLGDKRPALGDALRARGPLAALTEALAAPEASALLASTPDYTGCTDYASFRDAIDSWARSVRKQTGALKAGADVKNYLTLEHKVAHTSRLVEVPMQILIRNLNSGAWERREAWGKFQALKAEMPEDYLPAEACAAVGRPEAALTSGFSRIATQYSDAERAHIARRGGFEGGFLKDMAAAAALAAALDEMKPLDAGADSVLAALPAAWAGVLRARDAELRARIEAARDATAKSILLAPDSLTGDALMAHILAPHRGRAVMVDFWATWCGPCKAGNKKLAPVKEELKDEPLDYVYLTNESSPEDLWKVMAADLHGTHYRLNADQWRSLSEKFGFQGIPTYVFVDAGGRVTGQQTGFSGTEPIRRALLEALGRPAAAPAE